MHTIAGHDISEIINPVYRPAGSKVAIKHAIREKQGCGRTNEAGSAKVTPSNIYPVVSRVILGETCQFISYITGFHSISFGFLAFLKIKESKVLHFCPQTRVKSACVSPFLPRYSLVASMIVSRCCAIVNIDQCFPSFVWTSNMIMSSSVQFV